MGRWVTQLDPVVTAVRPDEGLVRPDEGLSRTLPAGSGLLLMEPHGVGVGVSARRAECAFPPAVRSLHSGLERCFTCCPLAAWDTELGIQLHPASPLQLLFPIEEHPRSPAACLGMYFCCAFVFVSHPSKATAVSFFSTCLF